MVSDLLGNIEEVIDEVSGRAERNYSPPPPAEESPPKPGKDGKPGKDKKSSAKASSAVAAVPAPVPVQKTAEVDPAEEAKTYDAAFNHFRGGNYQGALTAFQAFNQAYPKSPLAPSAQYWIGNSFFNLKDYKAAIATRQELISLYPKSPKVPDALLNIATCQQNMGDAGTAKRTLEDLLARYPLSDAADKAKQASEMLKQMEQGPLRFARHVGLIEGISGIRRAHVVLEDGTES